MLIVLFYILGFGLNAIASGVVVGLMVTTVMCEVFFAFSLIRLLLSKKVSGVFTRIGKKEKWRFDTAFYEVDGAEIPNIFPCEMTMRDKFYKKDKEIKLRKGIGGKCVYDMNATLTIIFGNVLFGVSSWLFIWGAMLLFGYIR